MSDVNDTEKEQTVPPGETPERDESQPPIEPIIGDEEDELTQLRLRLQEAQDRLLRNQAELENFRRRSRRDLEDQRRYAVQPLLTDLLPVMDNIDRAIDAAKQSQDSTGLLEGFGMVAQQLADTLQKHHCTRIEALGQPFDPTLHEAISQLPSPDYPQGTVSHVAIPGYQLHDRVVRAPQVIVSTGTES